MRFGAVPRLFGSVVMTVGWVAGDGGGQQGAVGQRRDREGQRHVLGSARLQPDRLVRQLELGRAAEPEEGAVEHRPGAPLQCQVVVGPLGRHQDRLARRHGLIGRVAAHERLPRDLSFSCCSLATSARRSGLSAARAPGRASPAGWRTCCSGRVVTPSSRSARPRPARRPKNHDSMVAVAGLVVHHQVDLGVVQALSNLISGVSSSYEPAEPGIEHRREVCEGRWTWCRRTGTPRSGDEPASRWCLCWVAEDGDGGPRTSIRLDADEVGRRAAKTGPAVTDVRFMCNAVGKICEPYCALTDTRVEHGRSR